MLSTVPECAALPEAGRRERIRRCNYVRLTKWICPRIPLPERQVDSYRYDDAGHLIERSLAGNTAFHARYDDAGRLLELGTGSDIVRWTYDGCGR